MAVMSAVDPELGKAGLKTYTAFGHDDVRFVVLLFETGRADLVAVIEANRMGQLHTGAASGVAAKHLARPGAQHARRLRLRLPGRDSGGCYSRRRPHGGGVLATAGLPESLNRFCKRVGAEPAEEQHEVGAQDIVVTATTSRDPVLRGAWLQPGALVSRSARTIRCAGLDNVVLERAGFVCCDSREQSMLESGDLIDPVAQGVLDWLEVHDLQEVVAGDVAGRQADDDIVVFKSNGIAAWDIAVGAAALERARERGSEKL